MGLMEKAFHDELTGKIMVVMLFLIFIAVAFVIFLHLYAKWYIQHSDTDTNAAPIRRRRLDFAPGYYDDFSSPSSITALHLGLDPTVLETIPILRFSPKDYEKEKECAVCLSELSEGEKFRILPKCQHGFHVECIDMWFQSHATCPLCRNPIQNHTQNIKLPSETTLDSILQADRVENTAFPTNVLFWGNGTQISSSIGSVDGDSSVRVTEVTTSSSSGAVAIDMPRQEEAESGGGCNTNAVIEDDFEQR